MVDTDGRRYDVQFETPLGGFGPRIVDPDEWTILIEPASREAAARLRLERKLDGRILYRRTVCIETMYDRADATVTISTAVDALIAGGNEPTTRDSCITSIRERISRETLIRRCKARGKKGMNTRWTLSTLCRLATAA